MKFLNTKRTVAMVLLAAMLASVTACGSADEETTAPVTVAPIVSDEPDVITPDMPDDLRFDGGTVRIACMESIVVGATAEQIDNNEASALGQEIYEHHK